VSSEFGLSMAPQKKSAAVPLTIPLPEPLLLDIKGAAHMLSSTIWTVRNLLWAKKIPFVKIGRRFLIDPADIRAFIAREKAEQMAA
jgi:excisionase family DNA binding protein